MLKEIAYGVVGIGLFVSGNLASALAGDISKSERVLLVTANLSSNVKKYKALYEFLDAQSISLARAKLGDQYRRLYVLTGQQATQSEFVRSISALAGSHQNQAVDALVHLHGSRGGLAFADGAISSARLAEDIRRQGVEAKTRALYSTACYGATHIQDFLNAGFKVASGARKVNTSSAYEYPKFMSEFGKGTAFGRALDKADVGFARNASDWIAEKVLGFSDVDSRKVIQGNENIRIQSHPASL